MHDTIVRHLRAGAFKRHAAAAAGVSEDALAQWLKRGHDGDVRYARFARDVARVVAEDVIRNQAIITAAALRPIDGDWRSAAWNLERKYPKLYGRAAAVAVNAGDLHDATSHVVFYRPDAGRKLGPADLVANDDFD